MPIGAIIVGIVVLGLTVTAIVFLFVQKGDNAPKPLEAGQGVSASNRM